MLLEGRGFRVCCVRIENGAYPRDVIFRRALLQVNIILHVLQKAQSTGSCDTTCTLTRELFTVDYETTAVHQATHPGDKKYVVGWKNNFTGCGILWAVCYRVQPLLLEF